MGKIAVGHRLGIGKRAHQPAPDIIVAPPRRQPAHLAQVVLRLGRMRGELGQRVILDDPTARDILAARLGLAPAGDRAQPAKQLRIAPRQFESLPCILGRKGEARRVGQPLHLLVEPPAAAILAQFLDHHREDRREVGDVGDRIIDLALVERAARPVGEPCALVERMAKHRFDQARIANLFAIAQGHRRNLRVEQWHRGLVGEVVNDFEVLPAGVKNLQHLGIFNQQVEQRLEVDPVGLRVDRCRFLAARDLDQA